MDVRWCYFLLLLHVCQLLPVTWAARRVDAHLRARDTMKQRRSKEAILTRRDQLPLDTKELFQLTEGEDLNDVRETSDALGTTIERLEETYEGIKVYDTVVTVQKTKDGALTGEASGTFIQEIDKDLPDTKAKLTNEDTLRIATSIEGDTNDNLAGVKFYKRIYIDDYGRARLVNIVSYLFDGIKRPFYVIDLKSGEILKNWQGLSTSACRTENYKAEGGNEKIGRIKYGETPYCIRPTMEEGRCYLENKYVRVIDMSHKEFEDSTETASFECEEGYEDAINGAYSPAIDAFFYGSIIGQMFKKWFRSTPLEDKVIIRVHYGEQYNNAYWNGINVTFGDGGQDMYPLATLDIVGHEIGHGITEQGSDLAYFDESGGLNEAFSDIMGETAEAYLGESDFLTGSDVMKHSSYLREFERPENDNKSISNVKDMKNATDPHYSSGVYRRVWYVVVKEQGMAVRDAAAVFLHANRMYWHSSSTFYDSSCGTLKAALDLGHDTLPFKQAFKDVGLEECDIVSHIFTLNNRRTLAGVLVSMTTNPILRMEMPDWSNLLRVEVESKSNIDVRITVMVGGWESTDENMEVVAKGLNRVKVPESANQNLFFKFARRNRGNDEIPDEVDVTASFTCKKNYKFESEDYWQYYEYYKDCA